MRLRPLHRREDGSVVVELPNGWPYHVLPDDPLWEEARALDWSQARPEPALAAEIAPAPPARVVTEEKMSAVLAALGYDAEAIGRALAVLEGGEVTEGEPARPVSGPS